MITHKEDVPLSILDGSDGLLRVEFTYIPGAGPTPPNWASGGEPGYGPEFEIQSAYYLREDGSMIGIPVVLPQHQQNLIEEYLAEYWEEPGPDPDEAYERRRDEDREDDR